MGREQVVKARLYRGRLETDVPCAVVDADPGDEQRVGGCPGRPFRTRGEVREELFGDLPQLHAGDGVPADRIVIH